MRHLIITLVLLLANPAEAQEIKIITYRQWQDLPQDTYVRIMHTADSLLSEYKTKPFNVEKKDGSCCFNGLFVIKEFYQRALIEQPADEDAKQKVEEIDNMIIDETLLFEEKQFADIVKRGDYYFEKGYYKKACLFYERAYELSPDEKSIKKKIKATKKRIKKYKDI